MRKPHIHLHSLLFMSTFISTLGYPHVRAHRKPRIHSNAIAHSREKYLNSHCMGAAHAYTCKHTHTHTPQLLWYTAKGSTHPTHFFKPGSSRTCQNMPFDRRSCGRMWKKTTATHKMGAKLKLKKKKILAKQYFRGNISRDAHQRPCTTCIQEEPLRERTDRLDDEKALVC